MAQIEFDPQTQKTVNELLGLLKSLVKQLQELKKRL